MTPLSPGSCALTHLDGAYVLGALAPEERLEFERHLADCPVCARSVQQLAGLPGLLSQVSVDVLEAAPADEAMPDTLLPALVREVRRERRRRRRWATGLVAAAAVVVVAGVSVAVITAGDDGGAPRATPTVSTAPERHMTSVAAGVDGWLSLTPVAWGTRLDLTCTYELADRAYQSGPPTYEMVVRTSDGGSERVASWRGVLGTPMTVTGATALPVEDIASVEVRTSDGRRVLRLATG